jgi:hypothetical protein
MSLLTVTHLYDVLRNRLGRKLILSHLSVAAVLASFLVFAVYSEMMTGTPFATFATERLYWKLNLDSVSILTLAHNEILDPPLIVPYLTMGIGGVFASLLTARSEPEREIGLFSIFYSLPIF